MTLRKLLKKYPEVAKLPFAHQLMFLYVESEKLQLEQENNMIIQNHYKLNVEEINSIEDIKCVLKALDLSFGNDKYEIILPEKLKGEITPACNISLD
jgi:uncharacterized protein Smg (DUF494 family)